MSQNNSWFEAIKKGDLDKVREFIAAGYDVYANNKDNETALDVAAQRGYADIVKVLLEAGVVNAVYDDEFYEEALFRAVRAGHISVVEVFLAAGAYIDSSDKYGICLLTYAAAEGQTQMARFLLQHGALVDGCEPDFCKEIEDWEYEPLPLVYATHQGYEDIVRLLIDAGAYLFNRTAEEWLAEARTNHNQKFTQQLWEAATQGDQEKLQASHAAGIDLDAADDKGDTALHRAASNNQLSSVETLLTASANPRLKNHKGYTPLMEAARQGHLEIVRHLIPYLKSSDKEDCVVALDLAATHGHVAVVQLLCASEIYLGDRAPHEWITAAKAARQKQDEDWAQTVRDVFAMAQQLMEKMRSEEPIIEIVFDKALESKHARNLLNYTVHINDNNVSIEEVVYKPSTHTVSLHLQPSAYNTGDIVTVEWEGLMDTQGQEVSGKVVSIVPRLDQLETNLPMLILNADPGPELP